MNRCIQKQLSQQNPIHLRIHTISTDFPAPTRVSSRRILTGLTTRLFPPRMKVIAGERPALSRHSAASHDHSQSPTCEHPTTPHAPDEPSPSPDNHSPTARWSSLIGRKGVRLLRRPPTLSPPATATDSNAAYVAVPNTAANATPPPQEHGGSRRKETSSSPQ